MAPRESSARFIGFILFAGLLMPEPASAQRTRPNLTDWPQHSMERPRPPVVDPGPYMGPAPAPSDAVVLFDGTDLDEWRTNEGEPAPWRIVDDAMEVVPGSGGIYTPREFGDVQLHIEFSAPFPPVGEGQDRGNSGVFFMGRYEVQVLDSYRNDTYPDGQAGSLFGQFPPLVNPARAAGEWNVYDIVFRAPRFDDGVLAEPATVTVFMNGVLVQDAQPLVGPTTFGRRAPYEAHEPTGPIFLQDHDHPVRFRNIWIREL